MTTQIYAHVDENGFVTRTQMHEEPPTGPMQYFPVSQHLFWPSTETSLAPKWINGAIEWVETATLEELKSRKNREINTARLTANRTSFMFNGKAIACDELSRSDIDGVNGKVTLTGTMPSNWNGYWKAIDNSYVPIPDVSTWTAFYTAMVDAGEFNFAHAQALKQQLANATTPESVALIQWGL